MQLPSLIEIRDDVMMGKPVLKGTRIPVHLVLQKIAEGETPEEIVSIYPQINAEHVQACLQYAAMLASEEVMFRHP
jgi:uncharacterized protein (DUF433 family)